MGNSRYGPHYSEELDGERLRNQLEDIRELMADHQWRTLREIHDATSHPEASISARLRVLRAEGYTVDLRRRNGVGGTYEYKVTGEPMPGHKTPVAKVIKQVTNASQLYRDKIAADLLANSTPEARRVAIERGIIKRKAIQLKGENNDC